MADILDLTSVLPQDIWLDIIKPLDNKQVRHLFETNSYLQEIVLDTRHYHKELLVGIEIPIPYDDGEWLESDGSTNWVKRAGIAKRDEMFKTPIIVKLAKQAIGEGKAVAIFVTVPEVINLIAKELNTDNIVSSKLRPPVIERNIKRFNKGISNIIIISGRGLSGYSLKTDKDIVSIISVDPIYDRIIHDVLARINHNDLNKIENYAIYASSEEEWYEELKKRYYKLIKGDDDIESIMMSLGI